MPTLYEKLWRSHVVRDLEDGTSLLYIDRHLLHEVSSPHAFARLAATNMEPRRRLANLAVADHAVPTTDRAKPIADPLAREQVAALERNTRRHGIPTIPLQSRLQGIVHVIGPELGFTQPGITIVCGDSHTSTHGAFGALAFGIGSSECGTVLATQCLRQRRSATMRIWLDAALTEGVGAKDIALHLIARHGTAMGAGSAIEFAGPGVCAMSMEARMTLCNMAIEAGARVGLVAPDETTFSYLEGRPYAPSGAAWTKALHYWRTLPSDADAVYDREVACDLNDIAPQVSWGTDPSQSAPVDGHVPSGGDERFERALAYMDLRPGQPLEGIVIDRVFIGSCTNGRIEDLRAAARVTQGRQLARSVRAIVVPGSGQVRAQAEAEGLDRIFVAAGFEWREPGCSMCVGMNSDRVGAGERCAATSNRNFEGRQGPGARTHLMSPAMAAAAAVTGRVTDVRKLV
jgi:3-isopropylmalate/(R)-2-methylmalate dehydratase large subunit